MAASSTENIESRELVDGKSANLVYSIIGTDDAAAAMTELKSAAPATFESLTRQELTVQPVWADSSNSEGLWEGSARYGSFEPNYVPVIGDDFYQFDTGGGNQHITQSLTNIDSEPADAPDFDGAIGVSQGGNVDGVDIVVPVFNFSETHYLSNATLTSAYKQDIFDLTGKVNVAIFKGFAIKEVLFLGASGSQRGNKSDWEISFRFAASPQKTSIAIGAGITIATKEGWEYLWVHYKSNVNKNRPIQKPLAAYVEEVYSTGDFSLLGIGV
jgi:hypothetical protein